MVLLGFVVVTRLFDKIYDKINHLISDSFNSLPIEKILPFNNLIILIKSLVNKNKNEYHYNIFL